MVVIEKTKAVNNSTVTILVADDDESMRRVLEFQLHEAGYQVLSASDGLIALDRFTQNDVACLITDLRMPSLSGLDLLRRVNAINPETPVVVITAFGDVKTAVEAMRAGAFDYITKPFNREQILLTVEKALLFGNTIAENKRLRRLVHESFRLENVIAASPRMQTVLDLVERVARTDATVLITGESGTGKELIAKGIHFSGARSSRPFIPVNCAAIPETLIEAELFGYKRGAFTGAMADTKGKFEEANNGTLFLDEISAMPLPLQPRLLRVLQEQEIVRLGESHPRKINVRIIAATNRNLGTMISDSQFREDLYYRLAVVPINIPPLRERCEDIPLLAEHFLKQADERHGYGKLIMERKVFVALSEYSWPGNVRELENVIERMVVLSDGEKITVEDLPEHLRQPNPFYADNVMLELPPGGISLEKVEREIIRKALAMHGGNQTHTAHFLDITRSALIYRMQKHGLASSSEGDAEDNQS